MSNLEKISTALATLIKGGILFILFLPLVMNSGFFFPFIVPRNVLFRIAVELLFAGYLLLAHINPAFRPKFNKIVLAVLSFFGIAALATLVGINIYTSFWSNYERMGGMFHYLHLALYFFVLFNTFKRDKDWHSFFTFSLFVSTLMCFIAFAQYLNLPFLLKSSGGSRLAATIGNASYLAAYLLVNIFFILYFLAKEEKFDLKLFSASFLLFDGILVCSSIFSKLFEKFDWGSYNLLKNSILIDSFSYPLFISIFLFLQAAIIGAWFFRKKRYAVFSLLSLILIFQFFIFWETETRGAIIGLGAGLVFLAFASLLSARNKQIKLAISAIFILLVISPLVLVIAKNTEFVKGNLTLDRLATISLSDVTTESRLATWQASWKGWAETPKSFLIGYGPENYYYVFNKYFPTVIYHDAGSQIWFDRAHNIIFDLGTTTGILGLGAYLSILGLAFYVLFEVYKKTGSISLSWLWGALIIAFFVQDLFVFDMLNTEILFYLFLAFIAYLAQKFLVETGRQEDEKPVELNPNYIYIAVIIILLLFGLTVNYKTIKANHYLIKAIVSSTLNEKMDYFKKSIYQSPIGQFEARQQLGTLVVELAKNEKITVEQGKPAADFATEELEKSLEAEPQNIRERLWLAMVYNGIARFDSESPKRAIGVLENYVFLSPTRPQVYFELGQSYLLLGNIDKAIAYYRQGVDLAPKVTDSRWNMIALYIMTKNFALADQELKAMQDLGWQPQAADYKKLIDIYSRIKNYDKMIEYIKKIVELDPSAQNYAQLAIIYAKAGKNTEAKEAVKKTLELNPGAADEAKAFLEKLDKGELVDK